MRDTNYRIGDKVVVMSDVPMIGGMGGVIVGEGEEECVFGKMWEVELQNGSCEWMTECDLTHKSSYVT